MLALAGCVGFYPAWVTARTALDSSVRETAQPSALPAWFLQTRGRYHSWADRYLAEQRGAHVSTGDVAGTEWPLFGTVFLLATSEELLKDQQVTLTPELRATLELAAEVVVHPSSATWVKAKWGKDYLKRENVFYRMLVILGLSSYESATGDKAHHDLMMTQATSLRDELLSRRFHLADDYPGECYPNDVLWAAAAVRRAFALDGRAETELGPRLMKVLDTVAKAPQGMPAFRVDAETARHWQPARGSANSGILTLAAELDRETASRWFDAYVDQFWEAGTFARGFREYARGSEQEEDVDSGPVILDIGTVASAFGIGAARSLGRMDYGAPLTMEAVAASWPTPFGLLFPGVLGWVAADGWCFGELAIQFAMTRPNQSPQTKVFQGSAPPVVWVMVLVYLAVGLGLATPVARHWRARWKSRA